MLKMRLSMGGTKKRPVYKIVVADSRFPRDGRFIEKLGFFNPLIPKEKKERVDTNEIAALIDKAKEEEAVKQEKKSKLTQSSQKNKFASGLTLSEEDALRAQIFGCWSVPLGLPYDQNLLVRIKLQLKKDGTIIKSEILDHERMNRPGQKFYKVLAESALRAIKLCQPLRVPLTGYEKWKDLQLNFDAREMIAG